ncbi:hypothetical protein A8C32_19380 [Flavivirga aquatica]|uniref:Uncharacterized protein n=1 Tax=Flavivirga aquatica TaxID=1849968 RepID=A0A1E5T3N3_9FLAO|nr:hypothetical protein [Flavivirga aquatica]OEK05995.1 hypothetical protein A8C32_19380 [Flavivirga aquatica]
MKKRWNKALNLGGHKLTDIAKGIDMKSDTLRKAIYRESINDGYLVLIEQNFGISKTWIKEGKKPILINKEEALINKIEEDSYYILEKIDPEKIVAYLLLREKMFTKLGSFNNLVEKLQSTKCHKGNTKKHLND